MEPARLSRSFNVAPHRRRARAAVAVEIPYAAVRFDPDKGEHAARLQRGMRHPPDMPKLQEDESAFGVDGVEPQALGSRKGRLALCVLALAGFTVLQRGRRMLLTGPSGVEPQ